MLLCSEVQTYPDTAEIPVRNKAKLRDQGLELCQERLNSCLRDRAKGGSRALSAIESRLLFEVICKGFCSRRPDGPQQRAVDTGLDP